MDVMYFNGRGKKSEQLVVRALHYITLHYISKACLEKFFRAIQNAMHFETVFYVKG